ncbi:hypothetical protein [Hyphomonas pacifica]|uniref:hypothetical protein n=1 Tax=Hyphomonas pacifica TaxID=1280941 RepID=UPI000DBFCC9E|nr:hypothetical protein [Hyphomonas pacifica]RAN37100.1 hypothetical protein HY11_09945 [Hyphomonas pacifica]
MSFFHPPKGFPPHLEIMWPLIWAQLVLLRAAIRMTYGRGVQYHWSVTPNGRVYLSSIDYIPGQKTAQHDLPHARRLAAACDGRAFIPAYTDLNPLSLGLVRKGGRTASARARAGVRGNACAILGALSAALRPLIPNPFSLGRRDLPLPET